MTEELTKTDKTIIANYCYKLGYITNVQDTKGKVIIFDGTKMHRGRVIKQDRKLIFLPIRNGKTINEGESISDNYKIMKLIGKIKETKRILVGLIEFEKNEKTDNDIIKC